MFKLLSGSQSLVDCGAEFIELVGYGGIQCNHGRGTVGRRPNGTEFKAVAGESKRRGAVAVGVVD